MSGKSDTISSNTKRVRNSPDNMSAMLTGNAVKIARRDRSDSYEVHQRTHAAWRKEEEAAQDLIPILGRMYKDKNIVVKLYHRRLNKLSHIGVMQVHEFVQDSFKRNLLLKDSVAICVAFDQLATSDMYNSQLDIGLVWDLLHKISPGLFTSDGHFVHNGADLVASIRTALAPIKKLMDSSLTTSSNLKLSNINDTREARDVVLFGFGRIGRLLTRLLVEKAGNGRKLMLRAIVVRRPKNEKGHLAKRRANLMMDTVHGNFNGIVKMDEEGNALIANGIYIKIIYSEPNPEDIDYKAHGINNAILIDNTGIFRTDKQLKRHLQAKGISRVVLTAPGQGDVPNIVFGINCGNVSHDGPDHVISAASCTTNAIVPILSVIDDELGIKSGHLETVHSFTNDQNLVDNFHKKNRRGRSAPCNMVLTETGAGKAAGKALPKLQGKLTASAIRVPTPNVSMAILMLNLKTATSADGVNDILRRVSMTSRCAQIGYSTSTEVCSSDFVGHRSAGIVDAPRTSYLEQRVNLYVWYDNEFGYSCQVMRLVQKLAGVQHKIFPPSKAFDDAVVHEK